VKSGVKLNHATLFWDSQLDYDCLKKKGWISCDTTSQPMLKKQYSDTEIYLWANGDKISFGVISGESLELDEMLEVIKFVWGEVN
jgi:hypothetical protein